MANTYKAYVTMGELEEEYNEVCKEIKERPVKHTWIWKMVNNLSQLGFISRKLSGKGVKGKTSLIGLPSFSAEVLNQFLRDELYESNLKRENTGM